MPNPEKLPQALQLLDFLKDEQEKPIDDEVSLLEKDYKAMRDPYLQVITASKSLSPVAKAYLRAIHEDERRRAKLDAKIARMNYEKSQKETDRSIISTMWGVPVGFQFGTALGLDGAAALIVDIIADPINLIAPLNPGKWLRASKLLKGMSASDKTQDILTAAKLLAENARGGYGTLGQELTQAIAAARGPAKDPTLLNHLVKKHRKTKTSEILDENTLKALSESPGGQDLARLLSGDRETVQGLQAALALEDQASAVYHTKGFWNQVREGERNILSVGIPFTGQPGYELALKNYADDVGVAGITRRVDPSSTIEVVSTGIEMRDIGVTSTMKSGSFVIDRVPLKLVDEMASNPAGALEKARTFGDDIDKVARKVADAKASIDEQIDSTAEGVARLAGASPKDAKAALTKGDVKDAIKVTSRFANDADISLEKALKIISQSSSGKIVKKGLRSFMRGLPQADKVKRLAGILSSPQGKAAKDRIQSLVDAKDLLDVTAGSVESARAGARQMEEFHGKAASLLNKAGKHSAVWNPVTGKPRKVDYGGMTYAGEKSIAKKQWEAQVKKARKEVLGGIDDLFGTQLRASKKDIAKLKRAAKSPGARDLKAAMGEALSNVSRRILKKDAAMGRPLLTERNIATRRILATKLRGLAATGKSSKLDSGRLASAIDTAEDATTINRKSSGSSGDTPPGPKDGLPVDHRTSDLSEDLARDKIAGNDATTIDQLGRDGRVYNDYLENFVSAISKRGNFLDAVAGMLNFVRTYPRGIASKIRILAGNNEDLLIRIGQHIDDPAGNYLKGTSPAMLTMADTISTMLQATGRIMAKHDMIEGFLTDYFPHLTKKGTTIDPDTLERLVTHVSNKYGQATSGTGPSFTQTRKFDFLKDLKGWMKQHPGEIELVSERADVVMEAYLKAMGQAFVRNKTFAQLAATNVEGKYPLAIIASPKFQRQNDELAKELPEVWSYTQQYVKVDAPGLHNVRVHPRAQHEVRAIFDRNIFHGEDALPRTLEEKFAHAAHTLSNFGKSSLFRFSLFHFGSVFVSMVPALKLRDLGKLFNETFGSSARGARTFGDSKEVTQWVEREVQRARTRISTASPGFGVQDVDTSELYGRFLIAHGTQGNPEFGAWDTFQRVLESAEHGLSQTGLPSMINPVTGLKHVNNLIDANLWDLWQNNSKFLYWVTKRAEFIQKNPDLLLPKGKKALSEIEGEIALFGNELVGGQAWERLLVTPKMRRWLSFAMLAPDWTASNLLIARDLFLTAPGIREMAWAKKLTPDVINADVRFGLAARYSFRTAVYSFLFGNVLNMAFTGGRSLLEADEDAIDKSTGFPRIELPYRRYDGRKQYMDILKQWIEPVEWIKPLVDGNYKEWRDFIIPKLGVLPRMFWTTIIGYDPQFEKPIVGVRDGPMDSAMKQLWATGSPFIPITAQEGARVLAGSRDLRSAALSSIGFTVRTEDYKVAKERTELEEALRLQRMLRGSSGR